MLSRRPVAVLGLVTLGYLILQVLLVPHDMPLEWDESVYTSQVAPGVPDALFSAPRARGVTWLVAPMAQLTMDPALLRWWMTAVATAGFFLAWLPWTRILPVGVLAAASGLFATLWVTVWYGPQVMPNLYTAFGALLAVGCLLIARERGGLWAYAGLAAGFAGVTLLRPSDVLWLGVVAGPAALLWRKWTAAGVILVAALAGAVPWVVEAYQSFGGLAQRWQEAGEVQGGIAPAPGFWYEFKAAGGPAFCRPCDIPLDDVHLLVWWIVLPVLALLGARRHPLPALTGLAMAAPYLFLVDYAAPRFLLPAYALLLIPAASAVAAALESRWTWVAAGLIAAHVAVQFVALDGVKSVDYTVRTDQDELMRGLAAFGVRKPCTLVGASVNPAHQFVTRCEVAIVKPGETVDEVVGRIPGVVAALTRKTPLPGTEKWERHVLNTVGGKPYWIAMVRPEA